MRSNGNGESATAPEPMGVAEGKLAMALVPMDAARQRSGGGEVTTTGINYQYRIAEWEASR